MTQPLLIALPGNDYLVERLRQALDADIGHITIRRFPDGETYLRYETPLRGRSLVLLCTLDRPDDKFLVLVFAAAAFGRHASCLLGYRQRHSRHCAARS